MVVVVVVVVVLLLLLLFVCLFVCLLVGSFLDSAVLLFIGPSCHAIRPCLISCWLMIGESLLIAFRCTFAGWLAGVLLYTLDIPVSLKVLLHGQPGGVLTTLTFVKTGFPSQQVVTSSSIGCTN